MLMHYTITFPQLQLSGKFTDLLKVNQLQAPYRERKVEDKIATCFDSFSVHCTANILLCLVA